MKHPGRKLSNYVIDGHYQLRHTLTIVGIVASLTGGLGFMWYKQARVASDIIEVRLLSTMSEAEAATLAADLATQDYTRLLSLIGFGLLMGLAVTGYGIVVTHKVAGPVYRVVRHLNEIRDGSLTVLSGTRKGDQLQQLPDAYRSMVAALRKRAESDIQQLDQAISTIQTAIQDGSNLESLKRLVEPLSAMRGQKANSIDQQPEARDSLA